MDPTPLLNHLGKANNMADAKTETKLPGETSEVMKLSELKSAILTGEQFRVSIGKVMAIVEVMDFPGLTRKCFGHGDMKLTFEEWMTTRVDERVQWIINTTIGECEFFKPCNHCRPCEYFVYADLILVYDDGNLGYCCVACYKAGDSAEFPIDPKNKIAMKVLAIANLEERV